jgi:exodeoxyribonuclease-3
MRIATWNVNGLRARLDLLLRWLRDRRPDVVGLQEIKLIDEQFPHAALRAEGYRAVAHGQKAWNGVAILSREDAVVTHKGLPGQEGFGARLISAEVGGLSFTTIYCPNGKQVGHEDYPRKLAWLEALVEHFARHDRSRPAVLCGDFNICPAPLDSWNEEGLRGTIFHTDAERAGLRRLLDGGFSDLYRERHPDEPGFTWWDYRAGAFHRNAGLRLDLLLATPAVSSAVRSVDIDRDYRRKIEGLTPSDHAPVLVDIETGR